MERHAAIVYPKDVYSPITEMRPGMRVIEAGLGSASLTAALPSSAVGPKGAVTSMSCLADLRESA